MYCNFKFIPGLGVIQRISDSSKCAPRRLIGVVHHILDKVGISCPLTALAKVLDFCEVMGQAISITTKVGRIWAGAEWHT